MKISDVRVRIVKTDKSKIKASASITIDDCFVVHDIKVIEGEKGLFIAMPSKKAVDGEYRDIAHPINSDTRERIQDIILTKYEQTLNEVGFELGVDRRYLNYMDMIADENLDAVIIASPDQDHREMIENCLQAGLHILCEKPLALTREDIDAIVAAVKKSDKKFMVGQICRYTPGFKKAKEIIESGAIGELTFVESEYAHDYVNVFAKRGGNWRCDPQRNGVVGGGCHAVDLLRWFAGDPYEVCAYGTHKLLPQVTYDDATYTWYRSPEGVLPRAQRYVVTERGVRQYRHLQFLRQCFE